MWHLHLKCLHLSCMCKMPAISGTYVVGKTQWLRGKGGEEYRRSESSGHVILYSLALLSGRWAVTALTFACNIDCENSMCHAVCRLSWAKTAHMILFWEFPHLRVLDISTSDCGASLAYFTNKMRQEWFHLMAQWQYRQVLGLGVILLLLAHHHHYSFIHLFVHSLIPAIWVLE